jgi:hypothetical protein
MTRQTERFGVQACRHQSAAVWESWKITRHVIVCAPGLTRRRIDPQIRYAKPAGLLAPGGAMVVAGCHWALPADADRFWADVQADYQAVGYEGSRLESLGSPQLTATFVGLLTVGRRTPQA